MNSKQLILRASRATNGRAKIEAVIDGKVLVADIIDLWSDVERDRLADAIHTAVPTLKLIAIHRELLKIDRENLPEADASPSDPWPPVVSIERPKVPAFPVATMPEPLRSWVEATAEACQVPADLPGLLALAACAGACARRVTVLAGRNWFEPVNLYVAVLLDPANRKSAVFGSAMKPLRLIEKELVEIAAPEYARAASERRAREAELKNLEKKAASGCAESMRSAGDLAAALSVEPIAALPKLLLDDATAEAIEMQLAAQGGRLVVAGCEGGLFDVMAGRYSSGVGNLDCFLKAHAGDDLRVDRVTRGSIVIDRCCLTLAYAVQPDVVRSMSERPSFRGRGLIGRFLYSIPETRLGNRRINTEPVPVAMNARYEELVRRLAAIPEPPELPWVLRLDRDAAKRFQVWQEEVERWLADDGRLRELRDWGGKLCGLTARLAAIMHLVSVDDEEPWEVLVSLPVIESAIELARWSVDHAEAVILGLMSGSDGPIEDAAYLLRWIRERASTEFSQRDAQVHGRSRFDGEPRRLIEALELLADRGWIRALPMPPPAPG
ncbi:MAG: YfjI family protein, partial [Pirellulaceae bacterium]|nr:YfjI family protein [Pirellulaceae bacterium]